MRYLDIQLPVLLPEPDTLAQLDAELETHPAPHPPRPSLATNYDVERVLDLWGLGEDVSMVSACCERYWECGEELVKRHPPRNECGADWDAAGRSCWGCPNVPPNVKLLQPSDVANSHRWRHVRARCPGCRREWIRWPRHADEPDFVVQWHARCARRREEPAIQHSKTSR